jgi:hypothetical protein
MWGTHVDHIFLATTINSMFCQTLIPSLVILSEPVRIKCTLGKILPESKHTPGLSA